MSHQAATVQVGRFAILCGAGMLAFSACSGGDNTGESVASQVQSAKNQASSAMATATGDGVTHCSLKVDDHDVQVVAKHTACTDVTNIWDRFPHHSDEMGSSQVAYNGQTYRCSVEKVAGTHAGACLNAQKDGFTFTD